MQIFIEIFSEKKLSCVPKVRVWPTRAPAVGAAPHAMNAFVSDCNTISRLWPLCAPSTNHLNVRPFFFPLLPPKLHSHSAARWLVVLIGDVITQLIFLLRKIWNLSLSLAYANEMQMQRGTAFSRRKKKSCVRLRIVYFRRPKNSNKIVNNQKKKKNRRRNEKCLAWRCVPLRVGHHIVVTGWSLLLFKKIFETLDKTRARWGRHYKFLRLF